MTVSAALFLAITKNIVYAAFSFLFVLLGVAVLFVFAGAEFVAVTQIMMYVGGVLVLIIFGVMLTASYSADKPNTNLSVQIPAIVLALVIVIGLLYSFTFIEIMPALATDNQPINITKTQQIGYLLLTDYVLPFEASGILLMVALIAAAMIAGNNMIKSIPHNLSKGGGKTESNS